MICSCCCDICKHLHPIKDGWKMCCDAFPDGIPLGFNMEVMPAGECANGTRFEENTSIEKNIREQVLRSLGRKAYESRND